MTAILGVAAFLLVPLLGLWVWRLEAVRKLQRDARIAAAFAAGGLAMSVAMAALSLAGIQWSRTSLFLVAAVLFVAGLRYGLRDAQASSEGSVSRTAVAGILVFLVLTGYGVLTARESAGDLHFFWGPKAVRFFRAGGIDVSYLADKNFYFAHPDYPPLLPMLYAWSHTVAHQFSFWAAVLTMILFLFGAVAFVRGATGDDWGALLMAGTLAYTFAVGCAAGGADPPLIFFEVIALAALTFLEGRRGADVLAAIGLAGAAWTKVEGATFVIAVVIALLVLRRGFLRTLRLAAPAALLLGAWMVFLFANGLVDLYRGATMGIFWSALPNTIRLVATSGTYELYALPWLAPIALVALGDARRAALPLVIAGLTLGATLFFYLHVADPTWWIAASAPRVLLTPLTALLIAAVAARRPPTMC